MKNKDLEKLLGKYANDEISDDEMQLLSSITHRNEVMKSALGLATQIRKKRRRTIASIVSVCILVFGVELLMRPMLINDDEIKIAKVTEEKIPVNTNVVESEIGIKEETLVKKEENVKIKPIEKKHISESNIVEEKKVEIKEEIIIVPDKEVLIVDDMQYDEGTQVLCNVQCDADSVINDVWNFLRT